MSAASSISTPATTPTRIDLKRDERLVIEWADGRTCTYSISLLRSMCPCAMCKSIRSSGGSPQTVSPSQAPSAQAGGPKRRTSLTVMPGNYSTPLRAESAELVGNYALRIEWSDKHGSGIYSFQYLREICPSLTPIGEQNTLE